MSAERVNRPQPKLTSFPKETIWFPTGNGKWASRAVTKQDKKNRIEFCVKRNWLCTGGCA